MPGQEQKEADQPPFSTLLFTPSSRLHPGNISDLFDTMSYNNQLHFLCSWAREFRKNPNGQDPKVVALIGSITKLNLTGWLTIYNDDGAMFKSIFTYLPFKNLVHIDLSHCHLASEIGFDVLARIASSSAFNNLVTLNLSRTNLHTLAPLLSGGNTFPQLTTLNLEHGYHHTIDLSVLATTTKLPRLGNLNLTYIIIPDSIAEAIASSTTIRFRLKQVQWGFCNTGPAMSRMLSSAPFASVEQLSLATTYIDANTVRVLTDGSLPRLTSFSFSACYMESHQDSQQLLTQFCASSASARITELSFDDCDWINAACLTAIGTSAFAPNLKSIRLSRFTASLEPLLTALNKNNTTKLKTLDLTYGELPLSDIGLIATSPCLSTLEMLIFSKCTVSSDADMHDSFDQSPADNNLAITQLAQSSTTLSRLTHLDLSFVSGASNSSLEMLLTSPHMSNNLVSLVLPRVLCADDTGEEVCIALGTHQTDGTMADLDSTSIRTNSLRFGRLQRLSAQNCRVGPRAAKAIANLSALTHLDLMNNPIGDTGLAALVALDQDLSTPSYPIPRLYNLVELSLGDKGIGNDGLAALTQSPVLEQLHYLDFASHSASPLGVLDLLNSDRPFSLRHLKLHISSLHERVGMEFRDKKWLQNCRFVFSQ